MMIQEIRAYGLKELEQALDELTDPNFRRLALMRAGRMAMKPILNDAIANAPILSPENVKKNPNIDAGTLKRDIKFRGKYNKSPKFYDKGRKAGKLKPLNDYEWVGQVKTGRASQQYAVPIEFGRDEYTVVRIYVFGYLVNPFEARMQAQEANPFMRMALDKNATRAIKIFETELAIQVQKMAKKQEQRIKKK